MHSLVSVNCTDSRTTLETSVLLCALMCLSSVNIILIYIYIDIDIDIIKLPTFCIMHLVLHTACLHLY